MANDVSYIQSPFNKSRKDKFLMVLTIPVVLRQMSSKFERSENTIMPDTLQFSIYGTIVPTINIPEVNVPYAGQNLAISSHARQVYQPNTVNFTIDNRFNNYWVIYSWLNLLNHDKEGIYDRDDRLPVRPKLDYRSDITVYAVDEYNKRIVEFLYTDAFPTSLGGINYNYRDSGELESEFTYSYSQLIVKPVDSSIENL
jgi:hypothetical protein